MRQEKKNVTGLCAGKERGFSFLELLLVVGVMAGVSLGVARIAQDWEKKAENAKVAKNVATVHEAASAYVQSNFLNIWQNGFGENGTDLSTAVDFNGDGTIDDLDVCCVGASMELPLDPIAGSSMFLKDATGVLPVDFPGTNLFGHGMTVFLRDAGMVSGKRTIEVITVTFADATTPDAKEVSEMREIDVARIIGIKAGVIPERVDMVVSGTEEKIRGVLGGWETGESELAALFTASGHGSMVSPPAAGGTRAGSFLIVYQQVSYQEDVRDDVLYRVSIPGHPELNRMETNLDMTGRKISGVEYLVADNMQVQGNLELLAGDRSVGNTDDGAFVVGGNLRVEADESHINETTRYTDPADAIVDPSTGEVVDDRCKFQGGWRDGGIGNATLDPAAVGPCVVSGGVLTSRGAVVLDSFDAGGADLFAKALSSSGGISVSGSATASSLGLATLGSVGTINTNTYISFGSSAGPTLTVTGASNSNPAILTVPSHGFTTGDQVFLAGFADPWGSALAALGIDVASVTVIDGNTIALNGVDSSLFGAFVFGNLMSGGGNLYADNASVNNLNTGTMLVNAMTANTVMGDASTRIVTDAMQAGATLVVGGASASTASISGSIGTMTSCTAPVWMFSPYDVLVSAGVSSWSCMPGTYITIVRQ